ncbi:MAG: acetylxylan esterase [Terrimicrobiaceae bacterium]
MNFAARIHCPTLVANGLADDTARPAGIAAALNALKGPKDALILPLSNHRGEGGAQEPYQGRAAAWKKAAFTGEPLPSKGP